MTNDSVWLRQLEAYLQEEIGAQGRMIALLEEHEKALLSHEIDQLENTGRAVQAEFSASAGRSRRRDELVSRLAQSWGVAPTSLTLSSIATRFDADGSRLRRQRNDLERAVRRVQRLARRTGAAARLHSRLSNEIVRACLAAGDGDEPCSSGSLVDARA